MHFEDATFPDRYAVYLKKKIIFLAASLALLVIVFFLSLSLGSVMVPLSEAFRALFNSSPSVKWNTIIFNVRLPRVLTAVFAGIGLSLCGTAMQSVLRNPLAAPFTLGISQAAAFGAAVSVTFFGSGVMRSAGERAVVITNPYLTSVTAFGFCLLSTAILVTISRLKRTSPEVMVLTGVALGSLFQAGLMFLQFFATDVQLAAMVFWTFGDVSRTTWNELLIIVCLAGAAFVFFFLQRWNYNAFDAGGDTAKSLGVRVEAVRITGMIVSSLVTAVIIALVGIIGFVGLVSPHIVRRIIGDDHRFLIPGAALAGAIILTIADTLARLILIPHVFPVAILTAFFGVPVFIVLIIKGHAR